MSIPEEEFSKKEKAQHESDFPSYEYLGKLGKSKGTVFKGRDRKTGQIVAVKYYRNRESNINGENGWERRFEREARIMYSLSNDDKIKNNIVKIISDHFGSDFEFPHIVMECVEGGSIASWLEKNSSFDILTTFHLAIQIEKVLDYLINIKGIFHCDIKAENILFKTQPDGRKIFLVCDFGISRTMDLGYTTGRGYISWRYASPERLNSPGFKPTKASEYYSLGVVLYKCLSGEFPFEPQDYKNDEKEFIEAVEKNPVPPLKWPSEVLQKLVPVPKRLEKLIFKLLSKKPEERLKNIDVGLELQKAMFDFLKEQAIGTIFNAVSVPDMTSISQKSYGSFLHLPTNTLPKSLQLSHTLFKVPRIKINPEILVDKSIEADFYDIDTEYQQFVKNNADWVKNLSTEERKNNFLMRMRYIFFRWIVFLQSRFSNF